MFCFLPCKAHYTLSGTVNLPQATKPKLDNMVQTDGFQKALFIFSCPQLRFFVSSGTGNMQSAVKIIYST